jgi:hypothetical protein
MRKMKTVRRISLNLVWLVCAVVLCSFLDQLPDPPTTGPCKAIALSHISDHSTLPADFSSSFHTSNCDHFHTLVVFGHISTPINPVIALVHSSKASDSSPPLNS